MRVPGVEMTVCGMEWYIMHWQASCLTESCGTPESPNLLRSSHNCETWRRGHEVLSRLLGRETI